MWEGTLPLACRSVTAGPCAGESDYMCTGEGGWVSGVGGYVAACVSFCHSMAHHDSE